MRACRRGLLAASLGFALTGCVQPAPPATAPGAAIAQPGSDDGASVVPARENLSPRYIALVGPKAQHGPPFLDVPGTNFYCLRSLIDRQTGETAHQLYVSDSYSGSERGWNSARDGAGDALDLVPVSRHEITCEGGCSYLEEFAANLPESELRASAKGLWVTFTARSGAEKRIFISGDRIAMQLAAVDARRNPVQPAAARQ